MTLFGSIFGTDCDHSLRGKVIAVRVELPGRSTYPTPSKEEHDGWALVGGVPILWFINVEFKITAFEFLEDQLFVRRPGLGNDC